MTVPLQPEPAAGTGESPRSTVPFFAAAFGITWLLQLPAVLAQIGILPGPVERYMLPAGLGAFGPLLAALLVARFEPGGVRALLRPLGIWRVGAGWYAVALGLPAAIFLAGMAVYSLFGGDAGPWLYPPADGQRIAAMIVFPIGEEIGWRGLAQPRLQRRHGALVASLLVGVGWALWHLPMFLLAGLPPSLILISIVLIVASSVVYGWLYNRTQGSLLLAILFHAGGHLNNPSQALPGNVTPFVIYTAAFVVAAGVVAFTSRNAAP